MNVQPAACGQCMRLARVEVALAVQRLAFRISGTILYVTVPGTCNKPMPHSLTHRSLRPLVAACVVFLLAAVAAASLIWHLDQHDIQEQRALASSQVIDHAQALAREIE